MKTYSVIHVDSGDEVHGNFTSEVLAYQWLENACQNHEIEPIDINSYAVEPNEETDD